MMVDVPRVPSLDHPKDLASALGGNGRIGVAGPAGHRNAVASALSDGLGWSAFSAVAPPWKRM